MSYEHLAFHPFPFSCKTPSPPLPSPLSTRVLAGGGEIVIASCLGTPPAPLSDQQHHHRRRRRWLHHLHDDYRWRRLPTHTSPLSSSLPSLSSKMIFLTYTGTGDPCIDHILPSRQLRNIAQIISARYVHT